MGIRDLTNKVANNGANVNGKLTAEEYNVLITQVKNMSNGAVYMGVATPTTTPQTFDGNVELVYLATTAGKYTAFGNIVVNNDEICALRWRYSAGWGKEVIATNDYTTEEKAKVAKIEGKQDTLTLTVKDNGNIVLGNIAGQTKEFMPATPSGDPMHAAFERDGAVWDDSIRRWRLNDTTLTNAEMMIVDKETSNFARLLKMCDYRQPSVGAEFFRGSNFKTNAIIPRQVSTVYSTIPSLESAFYSCEKLETLDPMCSDPNYLLRVYSLKYAFAGCLKFRRLMHPIDVSRIADADRMANPFRHCYKLEDFKMKWLKVSVSFYESPLLSKESVLYMIQNATPTSAITITLHAEAYARLANDADILAALAAQPNITLISA